MLPLSSVSRPSVHLSVRNGCIVDKHWVIEDRKQKSVSWPSLINHHKSVCCKLCE